MSTGSYLKTKTYKPYEHSDIHCPVSQLYFSTREYCEGHRVGSIRVLIELVPERDTITTARAHLRIKG